jgi:iron transport multicopper oxidase
MTVAVAKRRPFVLVVVVGAVVGVVLALALGLGLGLGLQNSDSGASTQPSSPTTTPSLAPLQSQPESNFVLNQLIGQPSQTRVYNFTVSSVQGAPDGVSRQMLVVNGTSHLPLLTISN